MQSGPGAGHGTGGGQGTQFGPSNVPVKTGPGPSGTIIGGPRILLQFPYASRTPGGSQGLIHVPGASAIIGPTVLAHSKDG